jgi:DnaK suppressor protein
LRALRGELLQVIRRDDIEEQTINAAENDHAHDYEDDAQRLAANELGGNVSIAAEARLSAIDAALQRIEDGTYGYSAQSGVPIPLARLDAYPEALYTLEEQQVRDRRT